MTIFGYTKPRVARLGNVYYGKPVVTKDSVRISVDPRTSQIRKGPYYELVFDVPDWDIISGIVEKIVTWWVEHIQGLEVQSVHEEIVEGNKYLVLQVRRKEEQKGLIYRIWDAVKGFLSWLGGIIVRIFKFILAGIRFFLGGILCFVGAWAVFNLAYGWYKLFALPLIPLGAYLMIKPIKEAVQR